MGIRQGVKLLGLHLHRYRQWREVLQEELRVLGWRDKLRLLLDILRVVRRNRRFKSQRFRRLRKCYRCPVFDRSLRRCRPYTGSPVGCGCWVPLSTLFKDSGFLTEAIGDPDKLCW